MSERLTQLEAEMQRLVLQRTRELEAAQNITAKANREFDKAAKPLAREINRLRTEEEKSRSRPTRSQPSEVSYAGLTDEEIAHFQELKKG